MYGAVTNLINSDLQLCVNYYNRTLSVYFVADDSRGGFCKINKTEVFSQKQSVEIEYHNPTVEEYEAGELEYVNNYGKPLFPFMIQPNNG
jgi:hypothetical protein